MADRILNSPDLTGKLPPQDMQAERSVLGSILLDTNAFDEVADMLAPDHFYSESHQTIYRAIEALNKRNVRGIDLVTLSAELTQQKKIDEVGGTNYIIQLAEAVPHSAHVKYYAKIVKERWIQRCLTVTCTEILRDCYSGTDDTDQVLQRAEQGIFRVLESRDAGSTVTIQQALLATISRINDRIQKAGQISGISTGFAELDYRTNGFQPAELVILAARPSMGKTALVCNIAEWVASAGNTGVLIFSLEQSRLELAERFLCIRARLDGHKLRKGLLEPAEMQAMVTAADELSQIPLVIDDLASRTVGQISAICRQMKKRHNIGLVILDYLQLVEPEDRKANREQQIAQVTRRLKAIAKENNFPVIALSQLNRGVEMRDDKRPRLADLRESGAIEQDADIVMFLHRPDAYDAGDRPGLAEIIVAKHRSGPTGIVNLQWRKESMRFTDYSVLDDSAMQHLQ